MTLQTLPTIDATSTAQGLAHDEQALLERLSAARREAQLKEGVDVDALPFWDEFWSAIDGRQCPPRIGQGSTKLEQHAAFLGLSVAQFHAYLHLVVVRDHELLDVESVQWCHPVTRQLWRERMCADIARNLANR